MFSEENESKNDTEWKAFRSKVQSNDGIIFITPEYNRSIPGALKNAIDIGSRPEKSSVWNNKPAIIVTVSSGRLGGYAAGHHLKDIALGLHMKIDETTSNLNISNVNKLLEKQMILNDQVHNFINQIIVAAIEPAIN